jgi:SAM-dependent methyltransferase
MESSTPEYSQRLRTEIERFRDVEDVHALPAIFHVWSEKYVRPKITQVCGDPIAAIEEFYARYITRYAAENPSKEIRIASIGAGNGDLEVRVAALLKQSGAGRFHFQCIDINPAMLDRGREAASQQQLAEHFEFVATDVSTWSLHGPLDVVMANHSLHHIELLESIFTNIHNAIGEKGYFLVCDMIGRNGHMRWPEALDIIHDIWRTMPDRYKYNHQLKRFEALYENWDCSTEGFEGIRAQDILPLLIRLFKFEAFAAFGNLPDIFVDRGFGHNFSPENGEDRAFIDRIGELNDRLISEGKIKPTQMVAVMRASGTGVCKCYLHWTPEFCVRPPGESLPVPIAGCGRQLGRVRGFWPDQWIASPFEVLIRVEEDLDSIFVEGYLPREFRHEPKVSVSVNGREVSKGRARVGSFSLRVPSKVPAGKPVMLKIDCDKTYCPARAGTGSDERDLAILLREIRLIPKRRS